MVYPKSVKLTVYGLDLAPAGLEYSHWLYSSFSQARGVKFLNFGAGGLGLGKYLLSSLPQNLKGGKAPAVAHVPLETGKSYSPCVHHAVGGEGRGLVPGTQIPSLPSPRGEMPCCTGISQGAKMGLSPIWIYSHTHTHPAPDTLVPGCNCITVLGYLNHRFPLDS